MSTNINLKIFDGTKAVGLLWQLQIVYSWQLGLLLHSPYIILKIYVIKNNYQNFEKWILKVEGVLNLYALVRYSVLNFLIRQHSRIYKLYWRIEDFFQCNNIKINIK